MTENHEIDVRRAALARLRFEQGMGVEVLPRGQFTPRAVEVRERVEPPPAPAPKAAAPAPSKPAAPVPSKAPAAAAPAVDLANLSAEERAARWKALEARALACTSCVLHRTRKTVVFGDGNRESKLVFVGEGPGADEDEQGKPFVGRAGQLLNKIIEAGMKLKREDVYICNVVKCRPPQNREPLPDEVAACNPFLEEQIALIRPKVIVTLGRPATKTLLNNAQGITSLRGRWFSYRGIPVMPTFHPAFLLRTYTEENRRAVWDDMKKVLEKLKE
ncbi:MAG TPA: uracil-DNA glycosylase [Planctomycetota bacterium]|nr:uracil-DNA glycosylase [Planctomycetota bacterium]